MKRRSHWLGSARLALAALLQRRRNTLSLSVRCLLALVFGAALTMSFAPARAWWFAPYCVAGFLLLIPPRAGAAWLIGAAFGLGWFGAGFWWILPALARFSDAGMLFSFQLTALLVLYLSLFPATTAAVLAVMQRLMVRRHAALRWLVVAAVFSMFEWARGNLFGGFPMLSSGYAHTSGPLAGFAPVIGVYGIGYLNTLIAAMLADYCSSIHLPHGRSLRWGVPLALALLAATGLLLTEVRWTEPTGQLLSVRLLQGNLAQAEKYTDVGFIDATNIYARLASSSSAQLTVLPETALPLEWFSMPQEVAQHWQQVATAQRTMMVIGAVVHERIGMTRDVLTNSAVIIRPDQSATTIDHMQRYDKRHLVPFAEALPPGTAWIGERLGLTFGELSPGSAAQSALEVGGGRIAMTICFEDLFDTEIAQHARDSGALLNLTNFAWFPDSFAPVQHLQIAQMRALETGRWFAQVANTGMTAVVDERGRIQSQLPADITGALDAVLPLYEGLTPFMRYGNAPLLLLSAAMLVCGIRMGAGGSGKTARTGRG